MTGEASADLTARVRAAAAAGAPPPELARIVHAATGTQTAPVPIDSLSRLLGIAHVVEAEIDGAAGLLTRTEDGEPIIIVRAADRAARRRFTIAHELAHHLLGHSPAGRSGGPSEEALADRLAAALLVPDAAFRREADRRPLRPSTVCRIASAFGISIEAAARALAERHPIATAVVLAERGTIVRCYRHATRFPRLGHRVGDRLPSREVGTSAGARWLGSGAPPVREQRLALGQTFEIVLLVLDGQDCAGSGLMRDGT